MLKPLPMRPCRPAAILLFAALAAAGFGRAVDAQTPGNPALTPGSPGSADGARTDPRLAPPSRPPDVSPLPEATVTPEPPQTPEKPGEKPKEKTEPGLPEAPYEQTGPKAPADPALPARNDSEGVPQAPGLETGRAALMEARFHASMAGVDGAQARLSPAVRRTVGALARLAWGRAALGGADPARLGYELSLRRRELAAEQQQLIAAARLIDRWRGGYTPSPGSPAVVPPGISLRDQRVAALQRSLTCGRRYAALVEWAAGHGGTTPAVRAKALAGC